MTKDETRFLLGRISRVWGRKPPAPEVLDEWAKALEFHDCARAHATLDAMVKAGAQGPNLAQLVGAINARQPSRITDPLESWDGPTEAGRAAIARIRAQMTQRHPSGDPRRAR